VVPAYQDIVAEATFEQVFALPSVEKVVPALV
jgi:hypothetical protein